MGGKGGGTTTATPELPPELRDLYKESGARILQSQRDLPLPAFLGPSGRFQTADRARQFGQAQQASDRGARIAAQPLASRGALNRTPSQTLAGIGSAGRAVSTAGRVPGQFNRLAPIANDPSAVNQFANVRSEFNRGVAPLQQYASQVPDTYREVRTQANPQLAGLTQQADRQVTGANIQEDPAYQAAIQAFESAILPQIQNSAALSGLGRSTGLQQSLAAGQAQYLLPVIQDTLAREERGIERGLGARQFGIQTAAELGLQEAQARERGIERGTGIGQFGLQTGAQLGLEQAGAQERRIDRQLDATLQQALAGERGVERQQQAFQFLAGQQQAAGQQDLQRSLEGLYADERSRGLQYQSQQDAFNQLFQLGQSEQDYSQGRLDRETQDYLRRQALAEQSLFQPFGQIAPSAIGQRSSSSGKK